MQIYNIHQTLKEKSLTKPTEISVSKKILQETTFRSICEWILLHRYKKKKKQPISLMYSDFQNTKHTSRIAVGNSTHSSFMKTKPVSI